MSGSPALLLLLSAGSVLRSPLALLTSLGLLAALPACNDVTRFSTKPGESYCGNIVAGPFVRAGFGPGVRMRLRFDADRLESQPGTISTSDELFTDAPLRPIPQLFHDPLSTLSFGEGRERNLVYVVTPTNPKAGPSLFAVVSLLHDGKVEVRLLRGAPPAPGTTAVSEAEGKQLFGVFSLDREDSTCGF